MTDPFIAEIRVFGFNFAPHGWAFCDGQLLPVQQNTALFSVLGTMYGGDGNRTFGLPNLMDASAVSSGQGPGLSPYETGDAAGAPTVTLTEAETPKHSHTAQAAPDPADQSSPTPERAMARSTPGFAYQSNGTANLVPMDRYALGMTGGSMPHQNMPPAVVLNFCIALQGVFPNRP